MVGDRWIIGWLPLSDVPSGGTPLGNQADALAAYSEDSSLGPPTARQAIGVWEVSGGSATGYYMFYKGHRVFYIHPASPAVILGSGFWLPQGGELRVIWPAQTQRWTLSPDGRSGSGSVDGGPSITARKLTTGTDTVLQSFKQARGLPVAKAQP